MQIHGEPPCQRADVIGWCDVAGSTSAAGCIPSHEQRVRKHVDVQLLHRKFEHLQRDIHIAEDGAAAVQSKGYQPFTRWKHWR